MRRGKLALQQMCLDKGLSIYTESYYFHKKSNHFIKLIRLSFKSELKDKLK